MNRSLGPRSLAAVTTTIALLAILCGAGASPPAASAAGTAMFPGPVPIQITHHLSLQEAARAGALKLTSKGDFEGDDVKAELEGKLVNAPITVSMQIEFRWADGHSAKENEIVRNDLGRLERATEKELNKRPYKTAQGQPINFELDFKWREPGQAATPGYDQVLIINPRKDLPTPNPDFRPEVPDLGVPNTEEVRVATFPLQTMLEPNVVAHESLHLMGLDDQYEDYYFYKGREILLPERGMDNKELAAYLKTVKPPVPHPSTKNVESKNNPGVGRCDIMGTGDELPCAEISKKDVKWIESQAGIETEAKPGEILLEKNTGQQNLAVAYPTAMIAPLGELTVAEGIAGYCIDHFKEPPFQSGFDVGPSAATLPGFAGVARLLNASSELEQSLSEVKEGLTLALWNQTDGIPLEGEGEPDYKIEEARALMARAGVVENSSPNGLTHLGNPNAASAATGAVDASGAVLPPTPAQAAPPAQAVRIDTAVLLPSKVAAGQATQEFLALTVGGDVSKVALELQRHKGHSWKSVKSLPSPSLHGEESELPLALGKLRAGKYRVQVTVSGQSGPPAVRTAALTVSSAGHHSGRPAK